MSLLELAEPSLHLADPLAVVETVVASRWFYYLDLIGTFAFAVSGAIKAYKLNYDYFGTFVLVSLPAVGGGTARDLLVGGDRHPPFVFHDPTYMYIVFGVVLAAAIAARSYTPTSRIQVPLNFCLDLFDTIGVAAFTLIGARVAVVSGLDWFWAPILAALTCAGGGVLSNAVTGHESDVFKGVVYEEIAAGGGLLFVAGLYLAPLTPAPATFMASVIALTLIGTFCIRWWVIRRGVTSPTLQPGGDVPL